ncbi:hypothetical protein LPJ78_001945 [Coemansia sp. RSA 989]|nr:hypothetical protein LPJ68_005447 [Coemansia sp. RSA 1086]KAJ1751085.1 hypothetical protein LPJ79_002362 [Coemansia sp. RSA 1821]KAJ1866288.1 hypothetical protein LPJ78_001945 [Coemansia sp. RSA 989]KAJ2676052.1 hypothetical protein IWW42_000721 [Coemansia sp. RSA 1085]
MEHTNPLQISFEGLSYSVRVPADSPDTASPLQKAKLLFSRKKYQDKVILHQLTGAFRPGRITTILGPSGSGKTTLLNLLAGQGNSGTCSGNVWVNGRSASGAHIRQLAGYVNQDDVILPTQTVREAVMMSIILRPPPLSSIPPQSPETIVNSIGEEPPGQQRLADKEADGLPLPATTNKPSLRHEKAAEPAKGKTNKTRQQARCSHAIGLFGLGKCQDTSIGDSSVKGISGGERKRTAIAMENVTQSPILFLDEPTSGLDAHSALMVMRQLKAVADSGCTVVTVLHQPSSEMFALIDDLLILFEGRTVFMGERASLVNYLDRLGYPCGMYSNPADHVFNAVLYEHLQDGKQMSTPATAVERAVKLHEQWKQSPEAQQMQQLVEMPVLTPISTLQFRRTSPASTQVRYLTRRAGLNAIRNKLILNIRVAQAVFFGLLIGFIFLNTQDRPIPVQRQNFSGALFFTAVTQFLLSLLAVVNVFTRERLVFLREWQGGYYGLPAYFVSKNIIELPIQALLPIIYSSISYWLLGLRPDGTKFVIYTATCICLNLCGFSFGLLLGSLFRDMSTILAALPAMFLPFLLFGGLLVNTGNSTVWLRWLQWISPIKYGYSAMMKNQFSGYVVDGQPIGDAYLEEVDLGSFSVGVNLVFVLLLAFIAWVSAYLALLYLTNKGRGDPVKSNPKRLQMELEGAPDQRFTSSM